MSVFRRSGSTVWTIEFVLNGTRHHRSSGTTDKRAAREQETHWRAELLTPSPSQATPAFVAQAEAQRPVEAKTLGQAAQRYMDTVVTPKGNQHVQDCERYQYARVLRDLGANTLLTDLTAARISTYRDRLLAEKLKPATVNRYLSAILALLNRSANEWGWLRGVPTIKLLRLNNARYRWLNAEEEARLLKHCPSHLHGLVVFLIETGARLGEALRLTWADVDLDRQPRGLVKFMKTKSGKPRGVPLTTRARATLLRLQEQQEALTIHGPDRGRVFLYAGKGRAGKGVPLTAYRGFHRPHGSWTTAVRRAGLGDLHLHDLRHTFASRLVMRGVPILAVSKLLGHASLTMTLRYAHLAPDGLDGAIAMLD